MAEESAARPVALVVGGRFGQVGAGEYEQQALRFGLFAGGLQQLLEIIHHHDVLLSNHHRALGVEVNTSLQTAGYADCLKRS